LVSLESTPGIYSLNQLYRSTSPDEIRAKMVAKGPSTSINSRKISHAILHLLPNEARCAGWAGIDQPAPPLSTANIPRLPYCRTVWSDLRAEPTWPTPSSTHLGASTPDDSSTGAVSLTLILMFRRVHGGRFRVELHALSDLLGGPNEHLKRTSDSHRREVDCDLLKAIRPIFRADPVSTAVCLSETVPLPTGREAVQGDTILSHRTGPFLTWRAVFLRLQARLLRPEGESPSQYCTCAKVVYVKRFLIGP